MAILDTQGLATNYRRAAAEYVGDGLFEPVTDSGINSILMTWGPNIQFTVHPLNYHEMDHETATDWAHKEIAGAAIYREWVGENDEVISLRGHLFPYRLGGMPIMETFESMRRKGMANPLMRGGTHQADYLGWYVVEKLSRQHTFISAEGIGRMIAFEATFVRVPVTDADRRFADVYTTAIPPQTNPNPDADPQREAPGP